MVENFENTVLWWVNAYNRKEHSIDKMHCNIAAKANLTTREYLEFCKEIGDSQYE